MVGQEGAGAAGIRLTARVTGMVQGVGFRYLTARTARGLGLDGTATNLADGSVEIIAEGTPQDVAALLAWLQSTNAPGWVDAVAVDYGPALGGFAGFGRG
ncbi:acylphosphatase [Pseudarthrobacter sp. P1]|uniref:acylphosphatase n=1 Tax=Pseudarthrobacter sp. P1 TaxID=3418418 RepID=UPI003CE6C99A